MVKTWDKTYASVGGRPVSRPADAFPRSWRRPRPSEGTPKWRSALGSSSRWPSGGEGWSALRVPVQRDAVDHERVAEKVDVLAGVADAVGPAEPEAVVETAVDALRVVAAWVEALEVWVIRRDRPEVLCAVELAGVVR